MAILGLALGIPVWYLQFLPIHGVVLPLVYYVMCKRLTQSFWLAMAATSVMVISVGTGSAFYSTWVHGWGFVLFPLFVWAYFRFLGTPSPKMLGLMVVFLISAFLYSYTVDVWIVTFSLVLAVSPILSRNWKAARAGSSFGLAALAITLYFNRVIYDAYLAAKRLPALAGLGAGAATLVALAQLQPTRNLLLKLKDPGTGPAPEQRERSWFKLRCVGEADGTRVITQVSGGDPGYGETSKMLAESALCLAHDDLPQRAGQLTPAVAMGQTLVDRLQKAGIDFSVVEKR